MNTKDIFTRKAVIDYKHRGISSSAIKEEILKRFDLNNLLLSPVQARIAAEMDWDQQVTKDNIDEVIDQFKQLTEEYKVPEEELDENEYKDIIDHLTGEVSEIKKMIKDVDKKENRQFKFMENLVDMVMKLIEDKKEKKASNYSDKDVISAADDYLHLAEEIITSKTSKKEHLKKLKKDLESKKKQKALKTKKPEKKEHLNKLKKDLEDKKKQKALKPVDKKTKRPGEKSDYRYDPKHENKPEGGKWEKTEKGWVKEKKTTKELEKPTEEIQKPDDTIEFEMTPSDKKKEYLNKLKDYVKNILPKKKKQIQKSKMPIQKKKEYLNKLKEYLQGLLPKKEKDKDETPLELEPEPSEIEYKPPMTDVPSDKTPLEMTEKDIKTPVETKQPEKPIETPKPEEVKQPEKSKEPMKNEENKQPEKVKEPEEPKKVPVVKHLHKPAPEWFKKKGPVDIKDEISMKAHGFNKLDNDEEIKKVSESLNDDTLFVSAVSGKSYRFGDLPAAAKDRLRERIQNKQMWQAPESKEVTEKQLSEFPKKQFLEPEKHEENLDDTIPFETTPSDDTIPFEMTPSEEKEKEVEEPKQEVEEKPKKKHEKTKKEPEKTDESKPKKELNHDEQVEAIKSRPGLRSIHDIAVSRTTDKNKPDPEKNRKIVERIDKMSQDDVDAFDRIFKEHGGVFDDTYNDMMKQYGIDDVLPKLEKGQYVQPKKPDVAPEEHHKETTENIADSIGVKPENVNDMFRQKLESLTEEDKKKIVEKGTNVSELYGQMVSPSETKAASVRVAQEDSEDNLTDEQIDQIVQSIVDKMSKKEETNEPESDQIEENVEEIEDTIENLIMASIRMAARGVQMNRKDKDLMDDTGGGSYKKHEPKQKPPRNDLKNPLSDKHRKPEQVDKDVNRDSDLKLSHEFIAGFLRDIIEYKGGFVKEDDNSNKDNELDVKRVAKSINRITEYFSV